MRSEQQLIGIAYRHEASGWPRSTLALLLALTCPTASLTAAEWDERAQFDIAAQPLDTALLQFSEQAGMQVLAPTQTVTGKTTAGIKGHLVVEQALNELLRGSGLRYRQTGTHAVTIGILDEELGAESLQQVIVTGSRIARGTTGSATSVTVVDDANIRQSGLNNTAELLSRVPSLGIGKGPYNPGFRDPDIGANYVDLRGLGIGRSLTLINGRRRVSGAANSSAVDLSTIPAGMIERVEIITGGASAVYGADAVSGVVNVILKDDFEGLSIAARTAMPQFGAGESYSGELTGGTPFSGDRGSLSFGINYSTDEQIRFSDVPWIERKGVPNWGPNAANTGPADGIPDRVMFNQQRVPVLHYAGTFAVNGSRYTVDPNLRLVQSDRAIAGLLASGGDGFNAVDTLDVRSGFRTLSAMTTVRYDIGDNARLFVESNFANAQGDQLGNPPANFGVPITRDNPFIPGEVAALMDANGLDALSVDRMNLDAGILDERAERTTYTLVSGLEGEFANAWRWQAFYQYGRYDRAYSGENSQLTARYLEAVDAVTDVTTGQPVCRSEAARAAGCVALNILGRDTASSAALAYINHTNIRNLVNTQEIVGAQLTGSLLDLPAGPLAFAAGTEFRQESVSLRDDGAAILGLINNGYGAAAVDAGFEVYEGFVEVVAPVLAGKRFFHELTLEGAVRFSSYDTIGDTTAWKAGLEWAPTPDVKFRATRARSVRAPNLNELFSPGVIGLGTFFEPCDASEVNQGSATRQSNCLAAGVPAGWTTPHPGFYARSLTGGNQNLDPETSNSWNLGVTVTPQNMPGLTLAVDYWRIEIADAVNTVDPEVIVRKCYDSPTLDNPFCPLIQRGTALDDFEIDLINVTNINVGSLFTDGVDVQASYPLRLSNVHANLGGTVRISMIATALRSFEELLDANDPTTLLVSTGEPANPKWRGSVNAAYENGPVNLSWNLRYVGASRLDAQLPLEAYDRPKAGARTYHDLFASYATKSGLNVYAGVNNVLGVEPPYNPLTYLSGRAFYDYLGRYFFLGASFQLRDRSGR